MNLAERFFEVQLPKMIVRRAGVFSYLRGTLHFRSPHGRWTVRLGDFDNPIERGVQWGADVSLWFFGPGFSLFLEGDEGAEQFMAVRGDVSVLEQFGRLLTDDADAVYSYA